VTGWRRLDRWLMARFLRAWLTFTGAALLAFVVLDLFANLEKLSDAPGGGLPVAAARRYGAMLPELYFTLGPFLPLLAAMWVVAQLQRQNELVPLVAAGESPLRLAWPLLLAGLVLAPVSWADRELLLPALGPLRRETRGPSQSQEWQSPRPIPDEGGGVLAPRFYSPGSGELRDVRFTRLGPGGEEVESVLAAAGRHERGGWRLHNGLVLRRVPAEGAARDEIAPIASGGWLLETAIGVADVEAAIDSPAFQSSTQIRRQMRRTPGFEHLAVRLHERFTYPLAGIALLLVSVPVTLRGQGGWDSFLRFLVCLGLGFAYFVGSTICYELGAKGALRPLTAAYGPLVACALLGAALLVRDSRRA
jgi:lipopolysaccharide export system permease protein